MNTPTWIFDTQGGNLIVRYEYDTTGNLIYQGWAQAGSLSSASSWRILKTTYDASSRPVVIGFANGSPSFSFIWDSRPFYTYS